MVFCFAFIAVVLMILAITGLIEESLGVSIALLMTVIFTVIVAMMAYKSDIKILTILMTIFTVVGVVLLGINVVRMIQEPKEKKSDFIVKIYSDHSAKKEQFTHRDRKIFTYNLSKVEIVKDGKTLKLQEALENKTVTLEEILDSMIPNENTDGYKIYYDGGNSSSQNKYSVVVCDSQDTIFAPYDYKYEEGLCN